MSILRLSLIIQFVLQIMKRSLAPPRRDKPTGGNPSLTSASSQSSNSNSNSNISVLKKTSLKQAEQIVGPTHPSQRCSTNVSDPETRDRTLAATQKFEQRYRNKNINILPTQMLVAFAGLTTLDISYNKLTDSQIELIMNSCNKLVTFCMQGNETTLIPAAIVKMKVLVNFRHDWLNLLNQDLYEKQSNLDKLRQTARKPQLVTKVNKIVGFDFAAYCIHILQISLDRGLVDKIQRSQCSPFAKTNMLKYVQNLAKTKAKQKVVTINQRQKVMPGCCGIFGFPENQEARRRQQKWKELPHKRQNVSKQPFNPRQTESHTSNIKIEDIRDFNQKQLTSTTANDLSDDMQLYNAPNMPLHSIFSNFDRNPSAAGQIDAILLQGYNPNTYDQGGLSPYHVCVIHRQAKGLQHLLDISSNNPGFFDLEMPSMREGRNILHYCVFMKNYQFTKKLIEFGVPAEKRDSNGARLIHLVDQNAEFLLLLRKLLRKKTQTARKPNQLAIPNFPAQNKKYYMKHPQRQRQQSKFRITYSKNDKLLDMFESAVGIPNTK